MLMLALGHCMLGDCTLRKVLRLWALILVVIEIMSLGLESSGLIQLMGVKGILLTVLWCRRRSLLKTVTGLSRCLIVRRLLCILIKMLAFWIFFTEISLIIWMVY